jgi:PKD repeat protein
MKAHHVRLLVGGIALLAANVSAAVFYVDVNSTNATPPYADWSTAATNIQDAVDAATDGDEVLVTNGVYQTGGKGLTSLTNRVEMTNSLTLKSVNGPAVTFIVGNQVPGTINDFGAVRCVYLAGGATLSGFTITNGATEPGNDDGIYESYGGGVYFGSADSTATNCVFINNSAGDAGGGAAGGTLNNCLFIGNQSGYDAGAYNSVLNNCVLTGNSSTGAGYCTLNNCTVTGNYGVGVEFSSLNNCIVYFNFAGNNPNNYSSCTFNYSCTTPLPDSGTNNLTADPQLADYYHISGVSPCVAAGSYGFTMGLDIDGESWSNPPSMGCDQYHSGGATGALVVALSASFTNAAAGIVLDFTASIAGHATSNVWDFADGTKLNNQLFATHSWNLGGDYPVQLTVYNDTYPAGITATAMIHVLAQPVQYVNAAGANPVSPYLSWSAAATNIQDAVDVAYVGGTILVTNGAYQSGGHMVRGSLTNRVALEKQVTLRSVNGPAVTIIQGNPMLGDSATRCVYLTNGAEICGFTLASGGTRDAGDAVLEQSGGGVFCENTSIVVSNCIFTGNSAVNGGGAYQGLLWNCQIDDNSAVNAGGGASASLLMNSALSGNTSGGGGGGADSSTLVQCTLTGNAAGGAGGGANNSTLTNCIIFNNSAPVQRDYNYSGCTLNYCCATPRPVSDTNSIGADPQLTDAMHISAGSPCIGAGISGVAVGTDIDGEAWAGPPSIGCDEYHSAAAAGPLSVSVQAQYTNVAVGFAVTFTATITGHAGLNRWDFGDGTVATNQLDFSHAWSVPGDHVVTLTAFNSSNPGGVSATVTIHVVASPVYYVSPASAAPSAPFSSWATAATNIQDAVDAASVPGAVVLVSNGVYQTGGRIANSSLTNRLALEKPVTIQSVNGPAVTAILGQGPVGDSAIRCVYMSNHSALSGFTLAQGATTIFDDSSGGGVYCASDGETVSNCIIAFNLGIYGAGAAGGTLNNCIVCSNQTTYFCFYGSGGGAMAGVLNNCLVFGNEAHRSGGGAESCTLNNCTVVNNMAADCYNEGGQGQGVNNCVLNNSIACFNNGDDAENSVASFTCTTPVQPGVGNFSADPLFVNWTNLDFHLQSNSPCINSGDSRFATGSDLDGNPRIVGAAVDFGAYEFQSAIPFTCAILAADTNVVTGFPLTFDAAFLGGHPSTMVWDFGNGSAAGVQLPVTNVWLAAGDYPVRLTAFNPGNPGGISATVAVHVVTQAIHYVSQTSTNPVSPFFSWNTAATNIQDAMDAAFVGGTVLVSNGVYSAGGEVAFGVTNRVLAGRLTKLESVNGPAVTMICGERAAQRVRCVYLANGTSLAGFTLTNGGAWDAGDATTQCSGGGAWCETVSVLVSNCVFSGNLAGIQGGGVYQGCLKNCALSRNSAESGGGAFGSTLDNCVLSGNSATNGGAADSSTLNNCVLAGNTAAYGGGAQDSYLTNCLLSSNVATNAGGASDCALYQCSLVNNSAVAVGGGAQGGLLTFCVLSNNIAGDSGGGAFPGLYFITLENCLVIGNSANNEGGGAWGSYIYNCAIISNTAPNGGGEAYCAGYNCTVTGNSATNGGGDYGGSMNNSIVYFNQGGNYVSNNFSPNFCCTTPLPDSGSGNIQNPPLFVNAAGGDFHLQSTSPCINAGNNASAPVTNDLDGNPRISGGTVDIGAYEYQNPVSVISYAWLQQYGLPIDTNTDAADPDGDGMNNYQEWIAGTTPTNALSVLQMLAPASTNNPPGLVVSWQSVSGITYFLQSSSNLGAQPAFSTIQSNIVGQPGTTSYTDTTATNAGPYFYRVGVQQ